MATGQVVRLVNEGDTPFRDMYANQPVNIPPHGQLFVDWDAMCLWLGHPDANDFDPRNRVRVAEYHRLRSRYGVDAQSLEQSLSGIPVDADDLFNSMRPKLAAYDTATEQRIVTVADDPAGDSLTPSLITPGSDTNSQQLILARMTQMEAEMTNLRAQLAQSARAEQARNDAQPIPQDNPDMADMNATLRVGGSNIPGTIIESTEPDTTSPRPPARTTPSEDTPSRVRVSQG